MKKHAYGLLALAVILWAGSSVMADTWCSTTYPGAIFCDDFDRYCTTPPAAPAQCTEGAVKDETAVRTVWPVIATDGNCRQLSIEDQTTMLTVDSHPFAGKFINGGASDGNYLGQSEVDLTSMIQAKTGNLYNTATGTDAHPLVLRFEMGDYPAGGSLSYMGYETGYMELALNTDHAQMDYIMVGWTPSGDTCATCFEYCRAKEGIKNTGPRRSWPTICQQEWPRRSNVAPGVTFPNPQCPPAQTGTKMALAIGANAMLDNDPCHCENDGDQVPQNWHLSFFDGVKWRILKQGMFAGSGDFTLGQGPNTVILTIKTSTVDIYHRSQDATGTYWVESTATGVPRLYSGAFNKLRMGAAAGCNLNNGSYSCSGPQGCIQMGGPNCDTGWKSNKSTFLDFDNVALYGGSFSNLLGACCKTDGTCVETFSPDCTAVGGTFQGQDTHCASVTCCPVPFADKDLDGDVDQDDFGAFQVCYTGSTGGVPTNCGCYDRNHDGNVDSIDLGMFIDCFTGANVPWAGSLTPSCVP